MPRGSVYLLKTPAFVCRSVSKQHGRVHFFCEQSCRFCTTHASCHESCVYTFALHVMPECLHQCVSDIARYQLVEIDGVSMANTGKPLLLVFASTEGAVRWAAHHVKV